MHPLARPPREIRLLLAVFALVLVALAGPPLAQVPEDHAFADQLPRWGVPHALDMLSNLAFVAVVAVGAHCLVDHLVWTFTDGLVSGHALKHVVAALAVLPVAAALGRVASGRQNGAELPARAA